MAQGQKRNILVNPLAAQAMREFKFEVAHELGISPPQSDYWGEMTARDCGSVGGNMVRKMVQDYQNRLVSGQITPGQVSGETGTGGTGSGGGTTGTGGGGGSTGTQTGGGPSRTHN